MLTRLAPLLLLAAPLLAQQYALGPDSQPRPDIPHGALTQHSFNSSRLYPGTIREYWVYVPAQYDSSKPACLMVFQDGGGYAKPDGPWRVPVVFDNLIHDGAMPPTIAVFVNPGVLPALKPSQQDRFNRSFEYDALGPRYVRFLLEELLPEALKGLNVSSRPDDRAIAGASSGGIAAFNAAFERPDSFHRVLSFIGSFTDLRGGDILSSLIRKTEPVPLRVFLQDGSADLNIYAGNWVLANQSLLSALEFSGYDVKYTLGSEGHNSKHGASILPDALRWLWRDYPNPVALSQPASDRNFVTQILDPSSGWQLVSRGHKFTEGPAVSPSGELFFVDVPTNRIFKIDADGHESVFKDDDGGISGLMFSPDGRLYAAQNGRRRIVRYDSSGKETELAHDIGSNDIAVSSSGAVYFTDPADHKVWFIPRDGAAPQTVHTGLAFPNGVRFSPDESLLLVADSYSRLVWSFQVEPDGSLQNGEPFYRLEMPDSVSSGPLRSHPDGLALDTDGYLYAATNLGIQICDQPGRVVAIIRPPSPSSPSNLVFGGPDFRTLYVTAGDSVYSRRLRRQGFPPAHPLKPPKPSL